MSSAETEVSPVLPTWPTGYTAENPAFGSAANSAPGRPSLPPLQEPSRPSAPAPSGAWAASCRDPSLPVSPPARRPRKSAPYLPPRASSRLAADPSQSAGPFAQRSSWRRGGGPAPGPCHGNAKLPARAFQDRKSPRGGGVEVRGGGACPERLGRLRTAAWAGDRDGRPARGKAARARSASSHKFTRRVVV